MTVAFIVTLLLFLVALGLALWRGREAVFQRRRANNWHHHYLEALERKADLEAKEIREAGER